MLFYDAQYHDGQPIICPNGHGEQHVVHGYYHRACGARMAVFAAYACMSIGCAVLVAIAPWCRMGSSCGLRKWSRRNTQLDAAIGADAMEGISKRTKTLAKRYPCSESTIERVIHRCDDEILRQRSKNPLPQVLGIDEHSIRKGRQYAVTLVDMKNQSVYEVLEGKSLETILPRIRSMPGADRVKVVCMDLPPRFAAWLTAFIRCMMPRRCSESSGVHKKNVV